MKEYSKETTDFIKEHILPKMGLKEMNDENIDDVVEYMFSNIETPLCNDEECGDTLTPEQQELLRLATNAITEITTDPDW